MDDRIKELADEHRIDAGRGVPLDQGSSEEKDVSKQVNSKNDERLDERIRKAGI